MVTIMVMVMDVDLDVDVENERQYSLKCSPLPDWEMSVVATLLGIQIFFFVFEVLKFLKKLPVIIRFRILNKMLETIVEQLKLLERSN